MKHSDSQPKIIHLRSSSGGIAVYGEIIETIYGQIGYDVEVITVDATTDYVSLLGRLGASSGVLCHFEVGAGDGALLSLSRQLLKASPNHQLVTLHDPGVVVWHPVPIRATASRSRLVRLVAKIWRKLIGKLIGPAVLRRQLADPRLTRVYLRPDLADQTRSFYLPQPTYTPKPVTNPTDTKAEPRIGYSAFWGPGKGLETLLASAPLLRARTSSDFALIIEGGAAEEDNHYSQALRASAQAADPKVELVGLMGRDGLNPFIQSLSVLVLPYWPELPNGTSSMAMRAAELGVPIIASDTPALKGQLGKTGAIYVAPKDPVALAAALEQFLSDPTAAAQRAKETQKHIFEGHNWELVGDTLSKIIEATS